MTGKGICNCLATLMLILLANPVLAAPLYFIQDLYTLGGDESKATAINDSGKVVGHSKNSEGLYKPFLYSNGRMQALNPPDGNNVYAHDINNSDTIVGVNFDGNPDFAKSWIYADGSFTDVPRTYDTAWGLQSINNNGVAVGTALDASWDAIPTVYRDGELSQLAGFGGAYDINDRQQAVGWMVNNSAFPAKACVWPTSQPNDVYAIDLYDSMASGINDNDQVVGVYQDPEDGNNQKAFFWNLITDETLDLGTLGGNTASASKINNSGQIVGYSETSDSEHHAFLSEDGEMFDLNDLISGEHGWDYLANASDVNELGQIVGEGYINGELHAFLLTPVPIPAPILLMGAGLVALVGLKRRTEKK